MKGSGRVEGTATSDAAETDDTFTLTVGKTIDGVPPTGPTIVVNNVFGWEIASGGTVRAELDPNSGEWDAYQANCPS